MPLGWLLLPLLTPTQPNAVRSRHRCPCHSKCAPLPISVFPGSKDEGTVVIMYHAVLHALIDSPLLSGHIFSIYLFCPRTLYFASPSMDVCSRMTASSRAGNRGGLVQATCQKSPICRLGGCFRALVVGLPTEPVSRERGIV